ncbi:MAG: hypothetical protein AAF997_24830 [Myxococcota bacterium]
MTLRRSAMGSWVALSGLWGLLCLGAAGCAGGQEAETPLVVGGGDGGTPAVGGRGGNGGHAGAGGVVAEAPFCTTSANASAIERFEIETSPSNPPVEGAQGVAELTFNCQFVGADGNPANGCEPETIDLILALGDDDDLADEEEALATCLSGCLGEYAGEVSQRCLDCFAIQTACESRFCLAICQTDQNYVCGECIDEFGCLVAFQACSGLPPVSARNLRTREEPDRF